MLCINIFFKKYLKRVPKRESKCFIMVAFILSMLLYMTKYGVEKQIFLITPTKHKWTQLADLTRMSHTLRLVPNAHWIVVEDSKTKSEYIKVLLDRSNLSYTHLNQQTVLHQFNKSRGMIQRNSALRYLRSRFNIKGDWIWDLDGGCVVSANHRGVVYFADDDNTYDLDVFEYIGQVIKLGTWPVGLVGGNSVEAALLHSNGTIRKWNTNWTGKRTFPLDMAAFAVNLEVILKKPNAKFLPGCLPGYSEDCFIKLLQITLDDFQTFGLPIGEQKNGTIKKTVAVWHTKTSAVKPKTKNPYFYA